MKKILLSLGIGILLILCGFTIFSGLNIFGFEIKGFNKIKEENEQLDGIIAESTKMASADYERVQEEIKENMKKLEDEKKAYEEILETTSTIDEQGQKSVTQAQKYEIEYLWAVIGNHAKSQGVEIKMDLMSGYGTDLYNLNFTIIGEYIEISDFVEAIENDSVLGFKIEEFALVPSGGENKLQATFVCKNIEIKELSSGALTSPNNLGETNANNTNPTNNQEQNQNTQPNNQINSDGQQTQQNNQINSGNQQTQSNNQTIGGNQ